MSKQYFASKICPNISFIFLLNYVSESNTIICRFCIWIMPLQWSLSQSSSLEGILCLGSNLICFAYSNISKNPWALSISSGGARGGQGSNGCPLIFLFYFSFNFIQNFIKLIKLSLWAPPRNLFWRILTSPLWLYQSDMFGLGMMAC